MTAPATKTSGDAHDQALIEAITTRTVEVLAQASDWYRRFRVTPPRPDLRFDLTGACAGQLRWLDGYPPLIRFNLAIAADHTTAFLAETVPHEVAHLVTAVCFGHVRPHGIEWQAVMTSLGVPEATRCHRFSVPADRVRRQHRWAYVCDCREHALSTTRHKRIESGRATYLCRHCGTPLRSAKTPVS